mmetsp:Transcript_15959/g.47958  ORF Transcript_15959/g.47958 Transcript_15959/m.47958 type:complete len:560 (-) Transcript_15959:392-2071(-)
MRRVTSSQRFDSRLEDPEGRQVCVVTTASLPWQTGTAVNPLLRAAYLAHETKCQVTLVIPWLSVDEQKRIFPQNLSFETPGEQAKWVKDWVLQRCGFEASFDILFYPGRYDTLFFSISPSQGSSVIDAIPPAKRDVAILDEPEHLTWFEGRQRWTDHFKHVVGIMHTNYEAYVREEAGALAASVIARSTTLLTRSHCHKVIKLSDAIQPLPRSTTAFVHGVARGFLAVGRASALQRGRNVNVDAAVSSESEASQADQMARADSKDEASFGKGAYFIGKAVWGKGYGELLSKMSQAGKISGKYLQLDCYGHGEDIEAIKAKARELRLNIDFKGAIDHLDPVIHGYKVLVNASLSDVVATTSAEALAMGKWILVADHPENDFFRGFDNALIYKNEEEFASLWEHAVSNDPPPLTQADFERLTWEAATQRLLAAAAIRADEWPSTATALSDNLAWTVYRPFSFVEVVSRVVGKHNGGREAEADLQRLLREDPNTDLVAPPPPDRPRFRFSMSYWHDSGFGVHIGNPQWLHRHHPALDWRPATTPAGALQPAIDSMAGGAGAR